MTQSDAILKLRLGEPQQGDGGASSMASHASVALPGGVGSRANVDSPYAPYDHQGRWAGDAPAQQPAFSIGDSPDGPTAPPHWRHDRLVDPRATDGDRTLATLMHLWWVFALIGLGPIAALFPLVAWMVRQSSSGFVDDHGREILNAQITLLIMAIIPPLWPVLIVWCVVNAIGSIRAAIGASRREHFRYPMTWRLIR
ncbi:MAG: DUF4870 domain-containing protein [Phycisphaerae bacterium]|nr:DUF4870 domain-containing protein [Phycisphaerae bacterium]